MRMLVLIAAAAIVTVAAAASTHKATTANAVSAISIDEISRNVDMKSLPVTVSALY